MTRDEKIALCHKLKGEGLSVREIANRTGIARATVGDFLLGDEHRHAVQDARAPKCPDCGEPMRNFHPGRPSRRCGSCVSAEATEKREQIAAMWTEGKTIPAIAEAIGTTPDTIGVEMCRMRADGWDLPYRRIGPHQPGKHPELRVAA